MSDWAENGLNPAFSFWNELFYVRRTSEGNRSRGIGKFDYHRRTRNWKDDGRRLLAAEFVCKKSELARFEIVFGSAEWKGL